MNISTNIVISLDTRRAKSDGSYPLMMRIGHQRRTIPIPIGISLKEQDWDDKTRTIKKSYNGAETITRLNNLIQKKRSEAMDIIFKLHESGQLETLSVADLKDRIYSPATNQSFFRFTEQIIDDLEKANRLGTARTYRCIASVLKQFNGGKDLSFKNITYQFLLKFEAKHAGKGNTANGLAVYMRTVRAIYNKAIKSGIVEKEYYPFESYKIKTVPTEKRALDWDRLKKIIELQLTPDHALFDARNYFFASYMMYGMNFSDMAYLKKSDIVDGRIQYRRKKTSKLYDIKVTESLDTILSHYINAKPESEYIFPIIKRESLIHQDRDIRWARKCYNSSLQELGKECKIEKKLTSYVSRHSFATQAMFLKVPLNAISAMLGHSSLKTTEIYLKSLPTTMLDDYNSMILHV